MSRPSFLRSGGLSLLGASALLLIKCALELASGPPPSNGSDILAWVAMNSRTLPWISEILFFATILLVPGVIVLYKHLGERSPTQAAIGCGVMAVVIALMSILLVVHGRLVFPIFGMRVRSPEIAEFVVAVFYGGWHAVLLLLAVATFTLSLALRGGARSIAHLGFVTTAADIIGSYPDQIGPVLTFVTQLWMVAWFAAVGFYLSSVSPPGRMLREPNL